MLHALIGLLDRPHVLCLTRVTKTKVCDSGVVALGNRFKLYSQSSDRVNRADRSSASAEIGWLERSLLVLRFSVVNHCLCVSSL